MNKSTLASIYKDGVIRASKDGCGRAFKSVFMVDIQNFAKSWSKCVDDLFGENGITALICQVLKGESELCCLKIPTKNLTGHVFIRSQNDLLKILRGEGHYIDELFAKGSKYKLYQRNGHAIEYMHDGDIAINSDIECINGIKISDELMLFFDEVIWHGKSSKLSVNDADKEVYNLLKLLFKGRPEINAFVA